jgi:hypothetical protein
MTVSERVWSHHKGVSGPVAGNWHNDCEYLEHLRDVGAAADPYWRAEIVKSIAKLTAKHNGQPTNFP